MVSKGPNKWTHATRPPRKATGPPLMSLIFRWQESKSERRACGGGGRPTIPPLTAERNIPSHATRATQLQHSPHNTILARERGVRRVLARLAHRASQRVSLGPRSARDCPRTPPAERAPAHPPPHSARAPPLGTPLPTDSRRRDFEKPSYWLTLHK